MADCGCNHFPASLGNVTFDPGVSVGIGTASPVETLELGSGLGMGVRIDPGNDTAQGLASYALRSRESGGTTRTWKVYTAPVGGGFGVAPNSFSVWDYPGSPGPGTAANPRLTILPTPDGAAQAPQQVVIDGQGRLGVGTASPTQALDVAGTLHVSGVVLVGQDVTLNGAVNKSIGGKLVDQGGCYYAN